MRGSPVCRCCALHRRTSAVALRRCRAAAAAVGRDARAKNTHTRGWITTTGWQGVCTDGQF
eukprot:353435-Chlamydomonas_euryale.AAC.6